MHYLCTTFGSAGDVHPMLGLALALQRRGHRATLVTNGYFRETAERYGLEFQELGTRGQYLETVQHTDLWHPLRAFPFIWRNVISPLLRPQYELFADLYRPGETVAVANCFSFGALLAQEKLGFPTISAHMQPAVIWSRYAAPRLPGPNLPNWLRRIQFAVGQRFLVDPLICPSFNEFRGELGLPPVRGVMNWLHSRWCVACLFPDWFAAPQPDWPSNLLQTDFPLWDEPDRQGLPAEVESFLAEGEPPIAFTPGSAYVHGRDFFATAVDVCRRLGRRGVLLTRFREQIPSQLPDGVRHFDYVPFSSLLPRCAASVHHGGIGSTAQALAASVPQFVMAMAHDQFDNGERIARLGVGDWVPQPRFKAPMVARKLRALLDSCDVAARCQAVGARLQNRDGLDRMAEQIDRFVEKTPPLSPVIGGSSL